MEIKFFCPHWGHNHLSNETFIENVKESGYDGVEMVVSTDEREKENWRKLLDEYQLLFIGQVIEAGNGKGFEEQIKETAYYLENAATMNPIKIDSFTGRDYFSFEQNSEIIKLNLEIAEKLGIPVVHEIHRGRFSFSAPCIQPYFNAFPQLRLNADFSHWCCVGESYLQEKELAPIMEEAIIRSDHIHARVGYPEGPQVNDPRAPEWEEALNHHLKWWDKIVDMHRKKGTEIFTITPEFGPVPYLNALPYTQQPIANQWEINVWMMKLLKNRYL